MKAAKVRNVCIYLNNYRALETPVYMYFRLLTVQHFGVKGRVSEVYIVVPINSSHTFAEEIRKHVQVPGMFSLVLS